MKYLLLRVPYFHEWNSSHRLKTTLLPPLSMGQVAAYLKKKNQIEQYDLNIILHKSNYLKKVNIKSPKKDKIKNILKNILKNIKIKEKPDVILLSGLLINFEINQIFIKQLAILLKKQFSVKIILGGFSQFSVEPFFNLLKDGIIDYVIKGGPELIDKTSLSKSELKKVKGIAFEDKGKIFYQKLYRNYFMTKPDFSGLDMNLYLWNPDKIISHKLIKNANKKPDILIIPFNFIIGCPNNCAFCYFTSKKRPIKYMKPELVVDSIMELSKKYNTNYFMFLNDTLNISKEYVQKLCKIIIKRKLKILWGDCVSSIGLDKETLELMKEAGCITLFFGLETGSERLLKFIEKKVKLENIKETIKISSELGIWNYIALIAGLPNEKKKDILQTIDFVNSLQEHIDEVMIAKFFLCDSSKFFSNPSRFGLKIFQDLKVKEIEKYNHPCQIAFNDIKGLKWKEKQAKTIENYHLLRSKIKIKSLSFPYEGTHLLYWLYSMNLKKSEISKIYDSIHKKIQRKTYLNISNLRNEILNVQSYKNLLRDIRFIKKFF